MDSLQASYTVPPNTYPTPPTATWPAPNRPQPLNSIPKYCRRPPTADPWRVWEPGAELQQPYPATWSVACQPFHLVPPALQQTAAACTCPSGILATCPRRRVRIGAIRPSAHAGDPVQAGVVGADEGLQLPVREAADQRITTLDSFASASRMDQTGSTRSYPTSTTA
eukprot:353669-Chlamydomonas_euryale.AAC.3